jgi:hypothetical protein
LIWPACPNHRSALINLESKAVLGALTEPAIIGSLNLDANLPHPWLQGERSVPFDESGILPVNWRRRGSSPANRGVPHFF